MMKKYEFTALLEYSLIIEAESEADAKSIVDSWGVDGWKMYGEALGLSDVNLINTLPLRKGTHPPKGGSSVAEGEVATGRASGNVIGSGYKPYIDKDKHPPETISGMVLSHDD